jgi:hypothetical protein
VVRTKIEIGIGVEVGAGMMPEKETGKETDGVVGRDSRRVGS